MKPRKKVASQGFPGMSSRTPDFPEMASNIPLITSAIVRRFFEKVDNTRKKPCWIWTGSKFKNGYGEMRVNGGEKHGAHRISWFIHFGKIPAGLYVCHDCPAGDDRACVNPDHLFLGTQKENMQDCSKKGRIRNGSSPKKV